MNGRQSKKLFVTGTDTEVGKTLVCSVLLRAFAGSGLRTAALKPVAAGAECVDGVLINDDALRLSRQISTTHPCNSINPFVFEQPIAPHIAAKINGTELSVQACLDACEEVIDSAADWLVIEGAGGWLVPLNQQETLADLAIALQAPVIMVVGLKLGCINHALLTAQAINDAGCELAGWVANHLSSQMPQADANIEAIAARVDAPLLGELPFSPEANLEQLVQYLHLDVLLDDS